MATSNSTNVNAREALIEFALRRMSMAYHGVLIVAKHFFQDSAAGLMKRRVTQMERSAGVPPAAARIAK
jgi:hypothetical protein